MYVIGVDPVRVHNLAERVSAATSCGSILLSDSIESMLQNEATAASAFWLVVIDDPDAIAPYSAKFQQLETGNLPPLVVVHPAHWNPTERGRTFLYGAFLCVSDDCEDAELSAVCQSALCMSNTRARLRAVDGDLVALADKRSREFQEARETALSILDFTSDMIFVFRLHAPDYPILKFSASAARHLREYDGIALHTPLSRYLTPASFDLLTSMLDRLSERLLDSVELEFRARDSEPIQATAIARRLHRREADAVMLVCRPTESVPSQAEGATEETSLQLVATRTGLVTYDVDVRESAIAFGGALKELTGFSAREFEAYQGGRWLVLIHPDDRSAVLDCYNAAVATVGKYEMNYRVRHKSGSYRNVEDNGVCIPGKDGRALRVLGTVKDVTHRMEQERAYRKAEAVRLHSQKLESLGVLAGGIAHDFNNILAAIIGLTSLSLRQLEPGSELHDDLTEVLHAGNRARDLVRQILTFSRQGDMERVPLDLGQIVSEAVRLVQIGLNSRIRIETQIDRSVGAVMANPAQMHQVVLNFCTNAVHSMKERGGVLRLSVRNMSPGESLAAEHPRLRKGRYVCLTVSDEGHGMSPHVMERIFDPFYTTKGPGEGTGMGLAVVHGIITVHGGVVDVSSAPGEGTTFHTYLPLLEAQDVVAAPLEEPAPEGKEHVVVVRTDDVIGAFVCSTLLHQGYAVSDIRGIGDALKQFAIPQSSPMDLVMIDAGMGYTGVADLVASIIANQPGLPVILLEDSGLDNGMPPTLPSRVTLIEKPLTFEQLARATRAALDAP